MAGKCLLCGHKASGSLCKRCADGKRDYEKIKKSGTKAQKKAHGIEF